MLWDLECRKLSDSEWLNVLMDGEIFLGKFKRHMVSK